MPRSASYTYDPSTGEWTSSKSSSSNKKDKNDNSNSSSKDKSDNLTSSTPDNKSSSGSVEKKYNSIEVNTLEGTLSFIVTKQTIKLKAGDTVKLKGLGKYLSGNYYVKDVTRQISSGGYSHSATLIKTNFGESLKVSTTTKTKKSTKKKKMAKKAESKKVSSSKKASNAKRTYTVKKGDSLWSIAKKFYGNGSKTSKIYDADTNKKVTEKSLYVGEVLVIS